MDNQLAQLDGEMEKNPEIRDILATIEKAKSKRKVEVGWNSIFGAITFKI